METYINFDEKLTSAEELKIIRNLLKNTKLTRIEAITLRNSLMRLFSENPQNKSKYKSQMKLTDKIIRSLGAS